MVSMSSARRGRTAEPPMRRRRRRVQRAGEAASPAILFPVRRYVIASLVLVIAAALGAAAYTAYAADREYGRLIATGDEAVSADQPFQALEAYSGAIAIRPEAMLAHLKRGMVYRSRGDLDEALKDLRRATELDPTATRPAELLGDTNMSLQRYDHAAARYETYLAVDDSSARV